MFELKTPGFVWLPYAVAALNLFALGGVAAVRWRGEIVTGIAE
jgi:hypothetical protein